MAYQTHVALRLSDEPGAVPTAAQLGEGALGFNTADGRIFALAAGEVVDLTDRYTRAETDAIAQALADRLDDLQLGDIAGLFDALAGKVNKEGGKSLSSNDYTDTDRARVAAVGSMANREVFISDQPPDPDQGNDGDIWIQHWST